MSYASAVADMVRKIKENEALQQSIRNNVQARKLQTLSKQVNPTGFKRQKLSDAELQLIRQKIKEKNKRESTRLKRINIAGWTAFLIISVYLLSLFF